jgi:cation:H+ antiporter
MQGDGNQPVLENATFLHRDGLLILGLTVALLTFRLELKGPGKFTGSKV